MTSLSVGQQVEAFTEMSGLSSELGHTISLHKQSLSGAVSGVASSGAGTVFTLTLPSDSAFVVITGKSIVSVFAAAGTSTVSDGRNVRVRGLLFGNAGSYNMVAEKTSAK